MYLGKYVVILHTNIAYQPVCEVAAVTSSSELVTELVAMLFLVTDTTM